MEMHSRDFYLSWVSSVKIRGGRSGSGKSTDSGSMLVHKSMMIMESKCLSFINLSFLFPVPFLIFDYLLYSLHNAYP